MRRTICIATPPIVVARASGLGAFCFEQDRDLWATKLTTGSRRLSREMWRFDTGQKRSREASPGSRAGAYLLIPDVTIGKSNAVDVRHEGAMA